MNYQDQWTRFHHKTTDGVNPSSGNGFLYTAYAEKAGLKTDSVKLNQCWELCQRYDFVKGVQYFVRNPQGTTSPASRDEVIGAVALELLKPEHLEKQKHRPKWNFSSYPIT